MLTTCHIAGITIGAVVVPQGMAYAKLANLEVQFGLYSSFMGVLVYWFFATSKDITIGVSGRRLREEGRFLLTTHSLSPSCHSLPAASSPT
jgi:MFS superfamily sulfate permease-like transporter